MYNLPKIKKIMTDKMLKFVNIGQQTPPKRDVVIRKEDFKEIYDEFINRKAQEQSSRCSQCGVPFCQVHCPLSNNIPDWLKLTAEGRLKEAYELSQSTNNMPEVCGRICPQDRLCEGNCVIEQSGHGTVTIGSMEKYITDNAWEQGWVKPIEVKYEKDQSVGIIGAGPAGLAAAEQLRKNGYQITVYDRYDRAGGLLIYGIPNFKLEKNVVERRTKLLKDGGIEFIQNFEVGKDATLDQLRKKHDAILIATGVYKPREINLPGNDLENIFPAMEFLTASNKKGLGDKVELFDKGILNAEGKDVVVIGGGDTAMDCVRTSIRQKANSVKCLYRRDKENMPGSAREVYNAEEEGVEFVWLSSPKEFKGKNKIENLIVNQIQLGEPDESGRRRPEIKEGSEFNIKADMVIKALGFDPEDLPYLFDSKNLQVTKWGTIKADFDTMETNLKGVFAAGDIVRGASLVVWAIKDGRDAASSIKNHLENITIKKSKVA
jgi:glutamate synthase (NADPH) small chain